MVLNDPIELYASVEPYSPPRSSPDPYNIDLASIPSPLPILGSLFGFSKQQFAEDFRRRLADISASQKRRLETDEVNALLYHAGKAQAIASWGWPTGTVVGLYRANSTRENYGFPFTKSLKSADGWFDGQRIRILGREILRGPPARNFVHGFRAVSYASFHAGWIAFLFTFYGVGVQMAGEMRDPRLKQFYRLVQGNMNKAATAAEKADEVMKARTNPQRGRAGLASAGPMGEQRKKHENAPTQEGPAQAAFGDDASPLAAEGYDGFMSEDHTAFSGTDDAYNSNNNTTNSDHSYLSPNPDRNTQPQKSLRYSKSSTRTPRPYAPPPSSPSLPSNEAPSPPDENSPSDSGSAISAWERIRREAAFADSVWPDGKE